MGKLREFQIVLEETLNDIACDMSYEIQEAIDGIMDEHRDMMDDRLCDLMDEYDLEDDDLQTLGLHIGDMIDQAIEDNRDWQHDQAPEEHPRVNLNNPSHYLHGHSIVHDNGSIRWAKQMEARWWLLEHIKKHDGRQHTEGAVI